MNQCPHPDCKTQKPREQYACRSHWFSLPKNIRDKIWSGYRSSAEKWVSADKEAMAYWASKGTK